MRVAAVVMISAQIAGAVFSTHAAADEAVAQIVVPIIQKIAPAELPGGVAAAVRVDGRTLFFSTGFAEFTSQRPITPDTLFNLASVAKVFVVALLADAAQRRELSLDDSVAKHVRELADGGDIRNVTLGQLAAYSSGLVLPQDHPPWPGPETAYTLPRFIDTLKAWQLPAGRKPGGQMIYSHAGYMLLQLALERRFGVPFGELVSQRVLTPLGLSSTALPVAAADPAANPRGELPAPFARRAAQGYGDDNEAIGTPGDQHGYYLWPGAGQMYSSARDMAVFLAANLNELPENRALQEAMAIAHRGVIPMNERAMQALAWEVRKVPWAMVDKYGGLNNASVYAGMIPERKIGVAMLGNRSNMGIADAGRAILTALAAK